MEYRTSALARMAKDYRGEANRNEIIRLFMLHRDKENIGRVIIRLYKYENLFSRKLYGYQLAIWIDNELNKLLNEKTQ